MIAADTSTWIAYLQGAPGSDTDLLEQALRDRLLVMIPAVLAELLSDPKIPSEAEELLRDLPLIEIKPGYWERTGKLRAKVLASGRRARLGDALIAQTCADHGVALLTRDKDFSAFAKAAALDLLA